MTKDNAPQEALNEYLNDSTYLNSYDLPEDDDYALAEDAFKAGWDAALEAVRKALM